MSGSGIAPALLVAMPQLLDPNFKRAVVLIVHHDDEGTFGVVLNRDSGLTAALVCESLDIRWSGDAAAGVGIGGPVQPHTGWVLFDRQHVESDDEDLKDVTDSVSLAGTLDVLRKLASLPPQRLRIFLGYAGWGPGQLESELTQGAWLLAPVSDDVLFEVEGEGMWEHVLHSLGVDPGTLVPSSGVH